jgi:hypothetical protein
MYFTIIYLSLAAAWAVFCGWSYSKSPLYQRGHFNLVVFLSYFLFPISICLTLILWIKSRKKKKKKIEIKENFVLPISANYKYTENGYVLHNWMDSDWFQKWEKIAKDRIDS